MSAEEKTHLREFSDQIFKTKKSVGQLRALLKAELSKIFNKTNPISWEGIAKVFSCKRTAKEQ